MKRAINIVAVTIVILMGIHLYGCGDERGSDSSMMNDQPSSTDNMPGSEGTASLRSGKESITGTVSTRYFKDSSCTGGNAVYIFEGSDAVPDDIDGIDPEPLDSVTVVYDRSTGRYRYDVTLQKAGVYTVAFTCQADSDDPAIDNYITFMGTSSVNVPAGQKIIKHLFN